jgi:hypothetical protein
MAPKKQTPLKRTQLQRIVLYPPDVVALTGRHLQTARRMLKIVRLAYGKSPIEMVTIREFSEVFGIEEELIQQFVK